MISRDLIPESILRIREMAAKIPSPVGERFAAKTTKEATKLYLYAAIGSDMFEEGVNAEAVAMEIDAAQSAGSRSLEVYVNSPGGVIGDGMAIYQAIRRFKGSRTVYVDGWAASIASVIALAGDRIITARGAQWMIHEPMGVVMVAGRRAKLRDAWEKSDAALASLHEGMLDVYVNRTKRSRDELDAWMRAETFMTAEQAVERGFSDEIAQDEPRVETAPRVAAIAPPVPRAVSPQTRAASARARARELSERFGGASPAAPGQPGQSSIAVPAKAGR